MPLFWFAATYPDKTSINGSDSMSASVEDIIIKMQQLLTDKKDALTCIYDLTINQKEDIETNMGDNLEDFIDKKQEQIDKIEEIDNFFNNVFQLLKSEIKVDTLDELDFELYPNLKTVKKQVVEIIELAYKTMEIENENKEKIDKIMNDIKSDLKRVRLGKKSIDAYDKPNASVDGIYIDRKK